MRFLPGQRGARPDPARARWDRTGPTGRFRILIQQPRGSRVRYTAALALAASIGCGEPHRAPDSHALNVALISIDTLAARHLGLYGYSRDTSPNLDRYAADAIVFENAISTAPKTPESHMSMFTSLYPSVHRVYTIEDPSAIHRLDESVQTLPEILAQNGYATVGLHGGGFVDGRFGFGQGFDEYRRGSQTQAEQWLERHAASGKFFLFYHTYRVHDPYTPHPPYDRRFDGDYAGPIVHDRRALRALAASSKWIDYSKAFWSRVDKSDPREVAHVVALYDGAIAEMDASLASLLQAIDRHAPRTIVILVSDHGEEFGEHGGFTHSQLYAETLHVPLIIRHPDRSGNADRSGGVRIAERVSLIDLAPTILEMLSIPATGEFQGRSLLALIDRTGDARPVLSEFPLADREAIVEGDWKLLRTKGREQLFALHRDPDERSDLLRAHAASDAREVGARRAALREQLDRIVLQNHAVREQRQLQTAREAPSAEVLEQLRALGYLE
ncbi:MAG TPA: sulfatase [Myxococcota bacterium]|nr:sulfatase [Myxococcota bacterium]